MKAIRIAALGGPEVLALADVALPVPQRGEVRIRAKVSRRLFVSSFSCALG